MVEIVLLSVDGCPHVDTARQLLKACVEQLHVSARTEEKVAPIHRQRSESMERMSWDRQPLPRLPAGSTPRPAIECSPRYDDTDDWTRLGPDSRIRTATMIPETPVRTAIVTIAAEKPAASAMTPATIAPTA